LAKKPRQTAKPNRLPFKLMFFTRKLAAELQPSFVSVTKVSQLTNF
jgi:hypothetical protein